MAPYPPVILVHTVCVVLPDMFGQSDVIVHCYSEVKIIQVGFFFLVFMPFTFIQIKNCL